MAGTNSQTFVIIDRPYKLEHIVIVVKRLTNSHNYDVADPLILTTLVKILLHQHNLRNNLTIIKVTLLFNQARSTESTADIAADLGGYTDRKSVVLAHEHRLNQHTVRQLKKVLDRSVSRLLDNALFKRIDNKLIIELGNQVLGQVGHFLKRLDPLTIEPLPNLTSTEFLFSLSFRPFNHFFSR